jgi:anaerobic magnesium-protoporphyrin IX monomethyl ester cyclase
MNVLVINPPIRLSDKPRHIPHGLAILANIIREKLGILPTFLDINAHRYSETETQKIIGNTDFDIVLIGGLAPTYGRIVKLSEFIKSVNPDAKIIAGGSAAMSMPEVLLKNSEVDIVCTGEGEITVVELLGEIEKGRNAHLNDIAGICYKENGNKSKIVWTQPRPLIQNLDKESYLPAYDLLPMDIYLSNPIVGLGRDIDMISTRGCPYQCTFCYQPWGHKMRAHSIDFIINTIKFLKETYDIDFISFQDDEFMARKDRVQEFCEKKNRFFPDLLWSCSGRTNIVARDEELVRLMRNSGCVLISFGFESGSQRMLAGMKKRQTIEEMEKTVKVCRKYGLPVPASFIIGMPGENDESCQETVDFCIRNKLNLDSLMFATPYPGTEIFDFALKTGRIDGKYIHEYFMKLGDARDFVVNLTDHFSDEELINKREEMMRQTREYYDKCVTQEEINSKTREIFGSLLDKYPLDEKDLEHRTKHGGMSTF